MKMFFLLVPLIILNPSVQAETKSVPAWLLHRNASQLIKDEKYSEARELLMKALISDPTSFEIHSNLGLTFEGTSQLNEAIASYNTALRWALGNEQEFVALFNKAQALGKAQRVDEAISTYQMALARNPNSQETKVNIELLMQQQQQQKSDQGDKDKEPKDGESEKNQEQPKEFSKNEPQKFKSQNLSEGDVKKILEELKNQEMKIHGEFEKQKQGKEKDREKDW